MIVPNDGDLLINMVLTSGRTKADFLPSSLAVVGLNCVWMPALFKA